MSQKIYGIDPGESLTPVMVRDAIIECFIQAHSSKLNVSPIGKEHNENYCREIVRKAFADSGGNFNNPNKEDIIGAMNNLAKLSEHFRDKATTSKHYQEIMTLVNKLD